MTAPATPTEEPHTPAPSETDFSQLVLAELGLPADTNISGSRWISEPPRRLFGIALSGGGIRSATFNLGLLQGLNELNFLRGFDYLSTVSGGGYTGAFWSLWRKHHAERVFPDTYAESESEPPEILHLRKFSRFLSPTLGVFSYDTGRMLVALINAVVPSMAGAATFLMIALAMALAIAWLILIAPAQIVAWFDVLPAADNYASAIGKAAFGTMLVFGTGHLLVMRALWSENVAAKRTVAASLLLTVLLSAAWGWWVWQHPLMPGVARGIFDYIGSCYSACDPGTILNADAWKFAFAPGVALLAVPSVSAVFRVLSQKRSGVGGPFSNTIDQVNSWYMFAAAAWIGLTLMWWIALFLYSAHGRLGALTLAGIPLAGVVAWASRFVGGGSRSGERVWQLVGRLAVGFASYIVLSIIVVGCMLLIISVHHDQRWMTLGIVTLIGTLYVLLLYDPNRVGLHDFYRGRIARSYGGAARFGADNPEDSCTDTVDSTIEHLKDDACVNDLPIVGRNVCGPTHLIVCAANDLTPKSTLTSMARGAQSAVLSRVGWTVGDRWARWPSALNAELPNISAAITASGAAFNTQMGAKSKQLGPATAFIMSALGLRLGLWVRAPRTLQPDESVVRSRRGFALLDELLGRSDSRNGEWVFLSDGGHFENTGMYELIKRHCRYILVSDCGEDGERSFDDLGSVVRRVREDFGVDIKINLEALKPDANGRSRQAMVAGDIHYPDGDTGTLLILKPSLTGSEPPDVLQYHSHNAKFPHQSTGDQFFDEAQWESYRRLGLHVARNAFASSRDRHPTLSKSASREAQAESFDGIRSRMALAFSSARREWLAMPADYTQRIERIARTIGSLDAIAGKSGSRLAREIYWELSNTPTSTQDTPKKGANGDVGTPNADSHVAAISAIRQALVVFESVFLSENLAVNFNQPMYMGVMNLMARWMSAPLTRVWWPLLSSTCGVAFRQFVDAQFLPMANERTLKCKPGNTADMTGLASRNRDLTMLINRAEVKTTLLTITIEGDEAGVLEPRAAHELEIARLDATTASSPTIMMWEARDLYVPPGLWGIGFGSGLLREIKGAGEQFVFLRSFWTGNPEDKKDAADLQQLYLDAGFNSATKAHFHDPRRLAVYAQLRDRWGNEAAYLPTVECLVENFDDADFAVLVRGVSAPT